MVFKSAKAQGDWIFARALVEPGATVVVDVELREELEGGHHELALALFLDGQPINSDLRRDVSSAILFTPPVGKATRGWCSYCCRMGRDHRPGGKGVASARAAVPVRFSSPQGPPATERGGEECFSYP